jgi:hypothetical protein
LLRLKNSAVGGQDTSPMAEDGESLGGLRECPLKKAISNVQKPLRHPACWPVANS